VPSPKFSKWMEKTKEIFVSLNACATVCLLNCTIRYVQVYIPPPPHHTHSLLTPLPPPLPLCSVTRTLCSITRRLKVGVLLCAVLCYGVGPIILYDCVIFCD